VEKRLLKMFLAEDEVLMW